MYGVVNVHAHIKIHGEKVKSIGSHDLHYKCTGKVLTFKGKIIIAFGCL